MHRLRLIVTGMAVTTLLLAAAGPAAAVRPAGPSVTRLVATARWVTNTEQDTSHYLLWLDLYAQGTKPALHTQCVTVTYPDGTEVVESGYAFPRSQRGSEVMLWLQIGEIPAGVTSLRVTAQVMRIGARNCCTPVGAQRVVEAQLPVRPAPPPVPSVPQVVFDVTFTTP